METRKLGELWPVSALTLGGGGLGQVWGKTDRDEAIATVRLAVERGITLIDVAPLYGRGEAEAVIGAAFDGRLPEGVRVTSKCMAGDLGPKEMLERLEASLRRSLGAMKLEKVDLFFLHSNIHPEGYVYQHNADTQSRWAVPWPRYVDAVIPAMEKLKAQGLLLDWGITGTGLPRSIMEALRHETKPAAVQAVANLLDSAGDMRRYEEPAEPRNIISTAKNNGVGVMGIRAVQAGALTAAIDRPLPAESAEAQDYRKADPYRALAQEFGEDPATLAHRYALAMDGIDTLVLGVKNRQELATILDAEAKGPLDAEIVRRIDALGLRRQIPRIPLDAPL
jgi:aryl-alcohol dehydrogenase-like predicted oxidoreductase